jgi:hypothetical protein
MEERMKTILAAGVALLLHAGVASATGINLSWDDCGTAGLATKAFECNTNTGSALSLVASFVPPPNVQKLLGIAAQLDINTGTALPEWWKLGSGGCRGATSLSTSFDFTAGPTSCQDFYFGQAAGAYLYDIATPTPSRARMKIQSAIAFNSPTDSTLEYYAFRVNISKTRTLGGGSCAGCLLEACIVLNSIQLFQTPESNFDPEITTATERNYVTWQSATIADCPQGTPVRSSTWGQLKSLYR